MLLLLLAILVGIEGIGLLVGAVFFFSQLFVQQATSLSGSIVIFVITLIIGVGVLCTALGAARSKTWVRGPILTWQILQVAVAISFFQGTDFWPALGWLLLVFSIASTGLLFSRPVINAATKS